MTLTDEAVDTTPAELDEHRWKDRRLLSWTIRAVAAAIPLASAGAVSWLHLSSFGRPESLLGQAAFWLGVVVGSLGTAAFLRYWTRRLLPFASLLRLSLSFPGAAPNRLSVARRESNTTRLESQLVAGSMTPEDSAAQNLIALVGLLRRHDRVSGGHSERVCRYATIIGENLDLDAADIEKLKWAALIHDIGKLSVPPHILNSDETPTSEDRLLIRNHPVAATAYLGVASAWLGDWAMAALEHHEHWDGNGYPSGLRGEAIGLAGRIVAVADAYDVMTAPSSYRTPCSIGEAREELARCAGSQFDPAVVRALLHTPIGRLRRLLGPAGWLHEVRWFPQLPHRSRVTIGAAVASLTVAIATVVVLNPATRDQPVEAGAARVVADEPPTTVAPSPEVLSNDTAQEIATTTTTTRAPEPSPPAAPPPTTPILPPTTTTTVAPVDPSAQPTGPNGSGFTIVAPSGLPRTLGDGELTSNEQAFVWFEPPIVTEREIVVQAIADGTEFAGDTQAPLTLPAGTSLCPAFVHVDPSDPTGTITVALDFGVAPLGFALRGEDLDATGSFAVDGVDHRSDGLSADDTATLDGTTIRLTLNHTVSGRDQIRIFLPC